jgi:hypothetical protein
VTAERNYVRVFFKDETSVRVRAGIAQWQLMLAERGAVRLSRSLIIKLAAIVQVQRVARDLTLVTLTNTPRPLRLGRRAASQLERVMPSAGGRRTNGEAGSSAAAQASMPAPVSADANPGERAAPSSAGNVSR